MKQLDILNILRAISTKNNYCYLSLIILNF